MVTVKSCFSKRGSVRDAARSASWKARSRSGFTTRHLDACRRAAASRAECTVMSDAHDYGLRLREQDVDPDPLRQFARWFDEAQAAGVPQPEAAAVATASAAGAPSVRMVLVKTFDERGFVFFTNYDSRKGAELTANPRAALMFHWEGL